MRPRENLSWGTCWAGCSPGPSKAAFVPLWPSGWRAWGGGGREASRLLPIWPAASPTSSTRAPVSAQLQGTQQPFLFLPTPERLSRDPRPPLSLLSDAQCGSEFGGAWGWGEPAAVAAAARASAGFKSLGPAQVGVGRCWRPGPSPGGPDVTAFLSCQAVLAPARPCSQTGFP